MIQYDYYYPYLHILKVPIAASIHQKTPEETGENLNAIRGWILTKISNFSSFAKTIMKSNKFCFWKFENRKHWSCGKVPNTQNQFKEGLKLFLVRSQHSQPCSPGQASMRDCLCQADWVCMEEGGGGCGIHTLSLSLYAAWTSAVAQVSALCCRAGRSIDTRTHTTSTHMWCVLKYDFFPSIGRPTFPLFFARFSHFGVSNNGTGEKKHWGSFLDANNNWWWRKNVVSFADANVVFLRFSP